MKAFILLLSLGICIINANAHALELTDAIKYTLENSPQIYSAKLALKAHEQSKARVWAEFFPNIRIDYNFTPQQLNIPDFTHNRGAPSSNLVLRQNLLKFGTSLSKLESNKNQLAAEVNKFFSLRNELALKVVTAYLDVLKAREVKKLRQDSMHVMDKHLKMSEEKLRYGEITKTQLYQIKAKVASSKAEFQKAEGELINRNISFIKLVGLEPIDTHYPDYLPSIPSSLSDSLHLARYHNPALKSLALSKEALRKSEKVAILNSFPSLDFTIIKPSPFTSLSSQSNNLQAFLSLEIPLFQGGVHMAAIKEARYMAQKAMYDYHGGAKQLEEKIIEYWSNFHSGKSLLQASYASLDSYKAQKEALSKEAELKLRTSLDVLDAEIDLQKAQINLIDAKAGFITSIYALLLTIGDLNTIM